MTAEKTYHTLMRLAGQKMDELRNNMNVFLEKKDALQAENEQLERQREDELKRLDKSPQSYQDYNMFRVNVETKQTNNRTFMVQMEKEVEALRALIMEQFMESKRYEKLLEHQQKQEAMELERIEINEVDERNMVMYRREEA